MEDYNDLNEVEEKRASKIKTKIKIGVVGFLTLAVGYAIGERAAGAKMNKGLDDLFKKDPTLKGHLVETMADCYKERLLKEEES